tara:strand:- start:857 stop:1303 length:447 start_codon:yes stop_codon:yes gene_type:complete
MKYHCTDDTQTAPEEWNKLQYETPGSAGLDLRLREDMVVGANGSFECDTKICVEIPHGYFGLVAPRSSTGKLGLRLANTVGIIDSDYRGSIILNFVNDNDYELDLEAGQRLAQLIVMPCLNLMPVKVNHSYELSATSRGAAGFGSTGS